MAPGDRVRPRRNSSSSQGQNGVQSGTSTIPQEKPRRKRGFNKAAGLERLIKKAGHPLNVTISEERRPVGENNELLSREIGMLTRYHAPMQHTGWHSISKDDKDRLYTLLKLKFNLDMSEDHFSSCVELLFSSCYKSFHHRCYEHYLKFGGGNNARENPCWPLVEKKLSDWLWLCDYFETEEFKKRSAIGKDNRSKLPFVHRRGTQSFVALQHELNCGEVELYKKCYTTDEAWASTIARDNHDEMVYMQNKPLEEGEVALTQQQICEVVLGKAYGYIRGQGHGPKPNRRASSSTSSDAAHHMEEELSNTKELVAAQQTQLETQQNQLETQQTQIVSQQARIDWLQNVVTKLAGVSPPMDDLVAPRTSSTTASAYVESVTLHGTAPSFMSSGVSRRMPNISRSSLDRSGSSVSDDMSWRSFGGRGQQIL